MIQTTGATPSHPRELEIDLLTLGKAVLGRRILLAGLVGAGLAAGFMAYKVLPRKYGSGVSFVFQNQSGGGSRLQQLALLTGNLDLSQQGSPFLAHLETFAQSREVAKRMMDIRYGHSSLTQVLLHAPNPGPEAPEAFYGAINKICELKRKSDVYKLSCSSADASLSAFLSETFFQTLAVAIEEKRRQSLGRKQHFVDSLVLAYRRNYDSMADQLKSFMMNNLGVTSPALLQRREQLMMEKRVSEEQYLLSIKEQEELRLQVRREEAPLIVLEEAFVPKHPYFPSKRNCLLAGFAAAILIQVLLVAFLDRKAWLRQA